MSRQGTAADEATHGATRPLILVSNDDGYRAAGLRVLVQALQSFADCVVCAPEHEQSGSSQSISLHRPLRLHQESDSVFAVDGTPVDAVYVALYSGRVLPRRPDLVVSGLNHGLNLGSDVFYSGTVAAAREGALRGIPSLAVSAAKETDVAAAAAQCARLAQSLLICTQASRETAGNALLLNANFPPGNAWPVRATRLGMRKYGDAVHFRSDPRGGEYLWIGSGPVEHPCEPDTDTGAYQQGIVGVTALSLDAWSGEHHALAAELVLRLGRA